MKKLLLLIIFSTFGVKSQTKVDLRDLSFQVPAEFSQIKKENKDLKYDAFYENGKIFNDSLNTKESPLIAYQYYENPGAGKEKSESVLKSLNQIMSKDYKCDTLIIEHNLNYSLARYTLFGKTLFEGKSLGEKGWLNIQLFDDPKHNKSNFQKMLFILGSVKHSGVYGKEYQDRMNASGNSSKWAIIAFAVFLAIYFLRKQIDKNNT